MSLFPALRAAGALAGCVLPVMETCALRVRARLILDAGPVFLPDCGKVLPIQTTERSLPPETGREDVLAVSCFGMSLLAGEARRNLFLSLRERAGHTLFLDFKTPERNLEWPAALIFTPLRHALSCGELERLGGMEGLLYGEKAHLTVLSRHTLKAGALCAILVQNRT